MMPRTFSSSNEYPMTWMLTGMPVLPWESSWRALVQASLKVSEKVSSDGRTLVTGITPAGKPVIFHIDEY